MEKYRKELVDKYRKVLHAADGLFTPSEIEEFRSIFNYRDNDSLDGNVAYPAMIKAISTALILLDEVNLGKVAVESKVIYEAINSGLFKMEDAAEIRQAGRRYCGGVGKGERDVSTQSLGRVGEFQEVTPYHGAGYPCDHHHDMRQTLCDAYIT